MIGTRSGACAKAGLHGACCRASAAHATCAPGKRLKSGKVAGNLSQRLVAAGVKGRHLTLKIKRKKAGAPEPIKFLVSPPLTEDHNACSACNVTASSFHDCFSCISLVLRVRTSSLHSVVADQACIT